ncbi:MAG: aminotransferase class I/II-fold pyridoxal phosphate-dependent enzyme, partial [Polyangiaceae bacterium]|nr:aminotransferase class I/II-fold pyridoxal phosphate-dependent enzyme [Polyangiaceae bacterium]
MNLRTVMVRSKQAMQSPTVLRVMSDDRVMMLADAVMDAPGRVRAAAGKAAEAWHVLVHGYGMPEMDPSVAEDTNAVPPKPRRTNGASAKTASAAPVQAAPKPADAPGGDEVPDEQELAASIAARTSLANLSGRDVFQKCFDFNTADNARKMGVYPYFRPLDFNDGPEAVLEGRRVLMLGSNNYLGLTTHPKVREAAADAIRKYGTSMTGSRLVNGSMKLHKELEEKLAA